MAEQDPGKMRMRLWLPIALIVCVVGYLVIRLEQSAMPVKTAVVERANIISTESTNGKVEPTEDFQAHAPVAGVVQKIWVDLGQKVQAGQPLVKMDASEAKKNLASAEAGLQAARATLQNMQAGGSQDERLSSKADLDSAKLQAQQQAGALVALQKLQAQGAASAAEVASAKQRLADTQVKLNQLQSRTTGRYSGGDLSAQRAQVAQAQATMDAARSGYSNVDIHAPFAGTVYAVPVAEYDFVKDGDDLVDVADLTQLQVHAYFDEPEVGKLAVGQPVKIVWEAKPNQVWHGHIIEAPTTIIAYNTRNVGECLITVDDAKGDLLPNVNVTVTVTTSQKMSVLSLPREALHTDGASDFVYKIVDGRLVKTVVHLGAFNTTRIEVASGLAEGDVVALRGMSDTEMRDGLRREGATLTMTIRPRFAAGVLVLVALSAPAQVSLSTAVDLALRSDPRVKMAEADVKKAQASVAEAHDAYIPTIGANAGVGDSVGVPLSLPVIFGVSSQSLVFNFSQKDYIRAARAGLNAAQLQLKETRGQIAEDVAVTYLNLDTAQRRRDAMLQEEGFATRLVTIVQERLDAGQDTKMELLKSRKTLAQIRLAKLQVEDDIAILSDHLARLMGVPGNPVAAVGASIPAMPAMSSFSDTVPQSYGVQAAFATADSKQSTAFGEDRYRYRPQVSFGANYSRISTDFTNYSLYYPGFRNGLSENAISVGMQIQLPLLDRTHQARAHGAAAEAAHARFEAQSQQNQFLEGEFKLRHSSSELELRTEVAALDVDLAQAQLDAIVTQSSADAAGTATTQVTPKDEQNARLFERQKYVEMLEAQAQLRQTQVNLMRQTRQLDDWLRLTPNPVSSPTIVPVTP